MTHRIQVRRDISENWASANPVLSAGEPGLDLSTGDFRLGNGETPWMDLPTIGTVTIPNPADADDGLLLSVSGNEYVLVPRSAADGVPPDPTTGLEGAVLTVANGTMQWLTQASGISGAPPIWPSAFPPAGHTHPAGQISDGTSIGRDLITAVNAQEARQTIGAGTGNGTSNLKIGTGSSDAASATHTHDAPSLGFTPAAGITATNVQKAIEQAAAQGGGGGGVGDTMTLVYRSGQYPAFPASKPPAVRMFTLVGPVIPTSGNVSGGMPSYVGNGATQVPGQFLVNLGLS